MQADQCLAGGYQAILHDMEATRYNFYLDEMIKRRNHYVIETLETRGQQPWSIPIKTLFPQYTSDSASSQ